MPKSIIANLGFILQLAGLINIIPVAVGIYMNETGTLRPIFLAIIAFFSVGFLLNATSERKELQFQSSIGLVALTFIVLPLLGAIPYFTLDPFNSPTLLDRFTNSLFESVSGFTTTGFSFIPQPEALPGSMILYRSFTELIGGVGIVFLLLFFFNSRTSLENIGEVLGLEKVVSDPKRSYLVIFLIYGLYITAFTVIFYALGFTNIITTVAFVIDVLTGGYTPSPVSLEPYITVPGLIVIALMMFVGSVNFTFIYRLLNRDLKRLFTAEVKAYLFVIAVGTMLLMGIMRVAPLDAFVSVLSMSSSTGLDHLNLLSRNSTVVALFLTLSLIGGCSFSMAGGIKIDKVVTFFRSCRNYIGDAFKEETLTPVQNGSASVFISALISMVTFFATLIVLSTAFTTMGVTLGDAMFEVGSALATNGASIGVTNLGMPSPYKWILMVAMVIGRVEVLSILLSLAMLIKHSNAFLRGVLHGKVSKGKQSPDFSIPEKNSKLTV